MIRAAFYILLVYNLVSPSYANPLPFGLELGKATAKQIEEKYRILSTLKTEYGFNFSILDPKSFDFDGLKEIAVTFDKNNVLQELAILMEHNQFDRMYKMLSEKYRVKEKNIPRLGDKYALYEIGDISISLGSYQTFPGTILTYKTKYFIEKEAKAQKELANKSEIKCLKSQRPLGLELGKVTAGQIAAKYKILEKGKTGLEFAFFFLDPKAFEFDGLKKIGVIFDKDNILQCIEAFMEHNQFDRMHKMLSEKYTMKFQGTPQLGDKYTIYEIGNIEIILGSYQEDPDLKLSYTTKSFVKERKKLLENEKIKQQKSKL